ncbi:MAG: parvulin-like peptidyl-prolyl isomerase, partial [Mariniblastus sp.]
MALTAKFSSVASRALLLTLSCLLAWTTHFGAASAQSQPRQQAGANPPVQNTIKTLAVVNGQPISRHQIAEECMRRFGQDVLDSRIKKLLVLDQCKKSGIVITEKDVNDELVGKAKSFGMSADKYVEMIVERRKISIDRLKNDIIWHELAIRRLASQNIQVTQQDLDKQMEFEFGAKVQVRQIVVDSQEKAEQIRGQLLAQPGNFERYAKQFSLDTQSSSMGGLLQPIRRNQGLPEFENVAFALQPNEISKVIPVANHFIVLRCEQIFPPTDLSPQEITYQQERMANEIKEKKLIESARAMFTVMQKNAKIVNVMNDPQLRKQMPGVAALVNGIKILDREVSEDCITRFGIQTTDTEINRTLLMQALKLANLQVSQEDITSEITRAAGALGHLKADGSPDVDNWLIVQTNNDLSKVDLYIEDQVWPSVALKKL